MLDYVWFSTKIDIVLKPKQRLQLRVSKKTEKLKKLRKLEKNNQKNRLNRLKFLKNWPVRFGFGFISLKPKKPNRIQTEKKPSQTEKT